MFVFNLINQFYKKTHIVKMFLSSSLCDRLRRSPGSKFTGKQTAKLQLLFFTVLYACAIHQFVIH